MYDREAGSGGEEGGLRKRILEGLGFIILLNHTSPSSSPPEASESVKHA